jgi:non-ribosomal peptide synthetase component E (peptide arylation enzyme)
MEVRIVGADGVPVPAGTEGGVQVRGPFLFVGYLREPGLTAAAFQDDWLDTGDLAIMDEEGFIRLSGRTKDIIIRGGENIPVAYVENVLYEHPALESVAVVALPHPRLQEIACAAVTVRDGQDFTFADMQAFLQEKGVAKQYWPEELRVMDEFPRTPSGKIQKFKLRDEVQSRAAG